MAFWSNWSDGKKWAMGILSALIVASIVGLVGWIAGSGSGLPAQEIPFIASSENGQFAIKSKFEGVIYVEDQELTAKINTAVISYSDASPDRSPRMILDVRLGLVKWQSDSWDFARRSERIDLGLKLEVGEQVKLDPFTMEMSLAGLESLSSYWLVFSIAEARPANPVSPGFSYAHTRRDLFSD